MKKYTIEIRYEVKKSIEVYAETDEEAYDLAEEADVDLKDMEFEDFLSSKIIDKEYV